MHLQNKTNYSYWELKQYFKKFDLIVIGSGIVGLSAAISFKEKNKKSQILVLERGFLPSGASSKNAGFACFGSAGELLDDLKGMDESVVWETVKMRWDGLQLLRSRLGDKTIRFKQSGGYELFNDPLKFLHCSEKLDHLNENLKELLGLKNCFAISKHQNRFKKLSGVLFNQYEGEIDSGMMMENLLLRAHKSRIKILNGIEILEIKDCNTGVELLSTAGPFKAAKVVVATNGFASQLLRIDDVQPARAQVLITKPIQNLNLTGIYHYEQGYYYFRNIDNRILLGGGRNLDFSTETTTDPSLNGMIQDHLDRLLTDMILPGVAYEIEARWTGIMGVGKEKKPLIQLVSQNVLAAVRMGGMGIAIGSQVGELAAIKISALA